MNFFRYLYIVIWDKLGLSLEDLFKYLKTIILAMDVLDIATLKKIIEKVPEDYEIEFNDRDCNHKISDKFEVDVSGKKLILKIY